MAERLKQTATQKVIVCLYLRKRLLRQSVRRLQAIAAAEPSAFTTALLVLAEARFCEAHNALESVKRVLWHDDWS